MHYKKKYAYISIITSLLIISVTLFGRPIITTLYAFGQNVYVKTKVWTLVLNKIERYYLEEVATEDLIEDSIRGMLASLDPHTVYFTKEDFEKWKVDFEGYHGISVTYDVIRNKITVLSVHEHGPAFRAGLKPGDRIVKINNQSAIGLKREEVPLYLMGQAGTTVNVSIERQDWEKPKDFQLTRQQIITSSVPYVFLIEPDIGYIRIARFTRSTENELQVALANLVELGMKRVLLDLRGNTGGMLSAAERVADMFLPGGKVIVFTKGRISTSVQEYISTDNVTYMEYPVIVLIDHISASGSEIVAGAIQDWDRGLIVGTTSFGKGLVQTEFRFQDGSALLVTTARYYTPSGRLIQRDFSELTRQEYFNDPFILHDDSTTEDRPIFHTSLGRTVYGGGGITPDLIIKASSRTITTAFRRLYSADERFFYTFCEEYAAQHPEISEDFTKFKDSFEITPSIYQLFVEMVQSSEAEFSNEDFVSNKHEIELTLKREFAFLLFGDEARYQIVIQRDAQLNNALEHFDEAQQLLNAKPFSERMLPGH